MSTSRRTALITGAAMGLGQAIASRMATDGHDLILVDIASTDATEVTTRELGVHVRAYRCDISSPDEIAKLAGQVASSGAMPDILIPNAAIFPMKPFLDTSWEEWRTIMSVNLDSLYLLLHTFVPGMVEEEWGRVVIVSSGAFFSGAPLMAPYTASKGGGIGLLRSVAAELGDAGVTVNAVAPGMMNTPGAAMAPSAGAEIFDHIVQAQSIKRLSSPEDVVGAISFLASDDSAFITGQTIPVDGGLAHV